MKKIFLLVFALGFVLNANSVFAGSIDLNASIKDTVRYGDKIYLDWSSEKVDSSQRLILWLENENKDILVPIVKDLDLNSSPNIFYITVGKDYHASSGDGYSLKLATSEKEPSALSNSVGEFEIIADDSYGRAKISQFDVDITNKKNNSTEIEWRTTQPVTANLWIYCSEDIFLKNTEEGKQIFCKKNTDYNIASYTEKQDWNKLNLIPVNQTKNSSVNFEFSIVENGNVLDVEQKTVFYKVSNGVINDDSSEDEDEDEDDDIDDNEDDIKIDNKTSNASDTAILKIVINILKADGSSNNAQLIKILELVMSLLEKK
jgi:hypothetical protein